ncbi:type II secretion system F family protein [Brevibacillus sp. NPDC058079]|uniref:type II secretion system F family protein n=1 Tax=Brevibacillus sp. NPDC058079 TaxID=3346330 RepID=UPI0036DFEE73
MQYIFAGVFLIFLFFFTKNLLMMLFSMENYNVHRKRLKQLKFQKKKEDADISEIIDTVTKPVIMHVFSRYKPKRLDEIDAQLKMSKWDKHFTPIQYRALNLLLKALGVIAFLLLANASMTMACIWAVALIFGLDFLFKNSINNRKEKLIADFPDFIRITEGYLSANVPFSKAVSESIKYVGDEWKPILQRFVIDCELKNINEALEGLKREVDMFEVREFVALVKLNLEQGGDAKDSFSAQADKIREMQMDMIAIKIGKRQTMGIVLQGPLLLCNLLVFGLPTVGSMTSFTSM